MDFEFISKKILRLIGFRLTGFSKELASKCLKPKQLG
jgi:hypothetical protein